MAELFLYGIIASLLQKIETCNNSHLKYADKKAQLKTDLIYLIYAVQTQQFSNDHLQKIKTELYDLDDRFDAEMDDKFFDFDFEKLSKLIRSSPAISKAKPGSRSVWKYLPEKLEWSDAGVAACFAYCALYPKDHVIYRETLVNQWMAEGFLLPSADEELEDAGNRYFNELVSKGAFQDLRFAFGTNLQAGAAILSCKMNRLACDEARNMAGKELQVIKAQRDAPPEARHIAGIPEDLEWLSHGLDFGRLYRGLGFEEHRAQSVKLPNSKDNTLRTFLAFYDGIVNVIKDQRFHGYGIRVLDLTGIKFDEFDWLRGLKHLRYLSLSPCGVSIRLGDVLYDSEYLQTLALGDCSQQEPPLLRAVNSLRHLYLETQEDNIQWLFDLTALRILELSECRELTTLSEYPIKAVATLRILRILDCPRLLSLGRGMESLPRMEELVFHNCPSLLSLKGRAMQEVPNLRRLELIGLDKLVELPAGLRTATSLQYLMISDCMQLEIQKDVLGHLKSLETLCIYNCPKLSALPEEIRSLTSLQSLHIKGCPNLYEQMKDSEDWASIAPDFLLQQGFQDQGHPADKYTALRPQSSTSDSQSSVSPQTSILPYFELTGRKKRGSLVRRMKPANTNSRWEIVRSEVRRMLEQARVRKMCKIQEELLEKPKLLCSLFLGGWEFERDTIVQLWMAGGLLKNVHIDAEGYLTKTKRDGGILEDYGSLYFQTLEKQDFLLPSTVDKSKYKVNADKVQSFLNGTPSVPFSLHHGPLFCGSFFKQMVQRIRDGGSIGKTQTADRYCQLKEENGAVCAPSSVKPWHVSLTADHINETTLFKTLKEFDGLRTLLFIGSSSLKQVPSEVFTTLTMLQTLDLSGSQISQLPSSIGNLTQLHYLDLSYTPIKKLPESTDCLRVLQTLKLKGCKHLVELPQGLKKLIKLRHLDFDDLSKVALMPRGLGALTELRTLSAFIVDNSHGCNIDELASLDNLSGSLCVSGLENVPLPYAGQKLLKYNKRLAQLQLRWKPRDTDSGDRNHSCSVIEKLEPNACLEELHISCYPGATLPMWMAGRDFTKLARIHLLNCENTELDIPLGELKGLEYLEIIQMNRVKKLDRRFCGDNEQAHVAFYKLKTLIVEGMLSLESWEEIQRKDFKKLSKLVIKQCPKLTELPFLPYLHSLKHLEISSSGIHELPLPQTSSLGTLKTDHYTITKEKYLPANKKKKEKYFRKLSTLVIKQCPKLTELPFLPYIRSLKHLEISSIGINEIPLPHTSSLRTLKIDHCPILKEKYSRGGVNWHKIQHVPEIWFDSEDAQTSTADTGSLNDDGSENDSLVNKPVPGSEDSSKDDSWVNKIVSGSEIEPSKELLPLVPGEKDMKLPTDDYELEKERILGSEESSKDDRLANEIVSSTETEACKKLPPHVEKDMMLYSLLFPDDYEFEKEKLIHLWIAAGFLECEPMEDDGHGFFDVLLVEGFIMKAPTDNLGGEMYRIDSKNIISSLQQLRNTKHFNEETVVANRSDEFWDISVRYMEVKQEDFTSLLNFSELRSILFLKGSALKTVPSYIFSAMKFLRILDLSDCEGMEELPSSVSYATNLRYLGLSGTGIERLPDSVTELTELQVLELKGCVHLFRLPKRMKKLTKLRHLDFDILGQLTSMPEGIGALVELRTLWAFLVGSKDGWNINELQNMNHLSGKLCISGLENVMKLEDAKNAALIDKNRLLQLELRWSNTSEGSDYDGVLEDLKPNTSLKDLQILCFPGSVFPKWVGDHSYANLDSVMLYKCENCKCLPDLGGLPNLKKLEIKEMHGVKEIDDRLPYLALKKLTIDGMGSLKKWSLLNGGIFPCLAELFIQHCPKLDTVAFSPSNDGIFPSIVKLFTKHGPQMNSITCRYVEIVDCPKLKSLPKVLRLDSLEKLIIKDCPFGEKYRKGRKGRKQISNAAEVLILPYIQTSDEDTDTSDEDAEQTEQRQSKGRMPMPYEALCQHFRIQHNKPKEE